MSYNTLDKVMVAGGDMILNGNAFTQKIFNTIYMFLELIFILLFDFFFYIIFYYFPLFMAIHYNEFMLAIKIFIINKITNIITNNNYISSVLSFSLFIIYLKLFY